MKILFSMWSMGRGGVKTAFASLTRYLESLGHEVKVVQDVRRKKDDAMQVTPRKYILGWTPEVRCFVPHFGRLWLLLNCLFRWKLLFARKTAWKDYDYDCFVLFNGYDMNAWIMRYARNTPSIMWLHEVSPPAKPRPATGILKRMMEKSSRSALRGFTRYVAVSRMAAESQQQVKGLPVRPEVINNLVDVDDIDKKSQEPQEEIIKTGAIDILYVGRLSPEKGVDRLIEALATIKSSKKINLWIIGCKEQSVKFNILDTLKELVAKNNLCDKVFFMGQKSNPYPYMKAADVLVLPSRQEGMGLVIWEALICGTPVIATDSGGPREALCDGRWGMVVPNSTEGLRDGIQAFINENATFDMKRIREEIVSADRTNRERIKQLFETIGNKRKRYR